MPKRVVIMGAAGRDFHNFNVYFREKREYEVVAFTATQIPEIEGRHYPPELAGSLYPNGIPIYPEEELPDLIRRHKIDLVVFAYSDVRHTYVMERASTVLAKGADFMLMGINHTMLESQIPVIAVGAVRTGSGKSQTTRKIAELLKDKGVKVSIVRHPMPYGDLRKQVVQRFASLEDLDKYHCTIEEREEYEPHILRGNVVYAGVDYAKILEQAEKESDIILWDGGNNDYPFYKPDLFVVVADPLRPGHESSYHPGQTNVLLADVIVINKIDTACSEDVEKVRQSIKSLNPNAVIVDAASPIFVNDPTLIHNKSVVVVEDGPTLTHGEMGFGVGVVAANRYGAKEIVDPRPYAVGSIKKAYSLYPQLQNIVPALGYSDEQLNELEKTLNNTPADAIIVATPIDLGRILKLNKPYAKVRYELQVIGKPTLEEIIQDFLEKRI